MFRYATIVLAWATLTTPVHCQTVLDSDMTTVIQDTASGETRSCVHFVLPETIEDKTVEYASLTLDFEAPEDSADFYLIAIHPMLENWSEGVGWESDLQRPGGLYLDSPGIVASVAAKRGYRAEILITELAQLWADGTIENRGLVVVADKPIPGRARIRASGQDQNDAAQLTLRVSQR